MTGPLRRAFSFSRLLPVILILTAIGLRIGFAIFGHKLSADIWSDMKIYIDISNDLKQGVWKASHFFQSIGYPLLLTGIRNLLDSHAGIVLSLLQALASCLSLIIIYRLTLESFGKKIALATLFIGTFHLPWILYSNFALPELFFTLLLSICAWCSWKIIKAETPSLIHAALWATSFIIAFWFKGTHAFWGPLFLLSLVIQKRRNAIPTILMIGTIVSLGLAAHAGLTYSKIGKIQLSASTGGLNFIEGKCPHKRNMDSAGYSWHSPLYYQLDMHDAKRWDRPFTESGHYFNEGIKCIQKDPFVLIQSLESIPFLFIGNNTWPFNRKPYARYVRIYELFFAVFLISGLVCFLVDFFKKKDGMMMLFNTWIIPILAIFVCVYIFKSEMRYRVPYDIWFIPIGVKGWGSLFRR